MQTHRKTAWVTQIFNEASLRITANGLQKPELALSGSSPIW